MLDGDIGEGDRQAVLAHVASCDTCPGLYRAMVLLQAELSRSGNPPGRMNSDG
jgi:anti-sigma factor RsiW